MVKIKVNVTKKHIENGVQCQSDTCPVALALQDVGFDASVEGEIIGLHPNNNDSSFKDFFTIQSPKSVSRFVELFDIIDETPFKPFSFILRLTNKQAKMFNIKKRYIVAGR